MTINELISKLEEAKRRFGGNMNILMECNCDVNINYVCHVSGNAVKYDGEHIRLTDNNESIPEIYCADPDDEDEILVEVL